MHCTAESRPGPGCEEGETWYAYLYSTVRCAYVEYIERVEYTRFTIDEHEPSLFTSQIGDRGWLEYECEL